MLLIMSARRISEQTKLLGVTWTRGFVDGEDNLPLNQRFANYRLARSSLDVRLIRASEKEGVMRRSVGLSGYHSNIKK